MKWVEQMELLASRQQTTPRVVHPFFRGFSAGPGERWREHSLASALQQRVD